MIKTFAASFKLRNTYKTNSIIYILKSIPLVKKLLPEALYASTRLKTFANVVSAIREIGSVFLGKVLYLLIMVFYPLQLMDKPDTFAHVFFFLSLAGGLMNTHLFNPTKDKYYAMILMRMDAREYTLANYLYYLLKMAVGFLPFTLLFGSMMNTGLWVCLVMPFFVCGVKIIVAAITLFNSRDGEKVRNENRPTAVIWTGTALALIAAYLPVLLGYVMSESVFLILCAALIIASVPCFLYLWRFKKYRAIYRSLLTSGNIAMNTINSTETTKNMYRKKIVTDLSQTSDKSGYAYFNELFMKRHSKTLTKAAKKITLAAAVLLVAVAVAGYYWPEVMRITNKLLLTYWSYSLLLMYFINRGRTITAAMFMNCDHSMLSYRMFRQPKAILTLFRERLKYVCAINLMPASILAVGFPVLLYISGGADNLLTYFVIAASLLAMSVFFSAHTLVLYYLLQPYNDKIEIKSPFYIIIDIATYYVCFFAAGEAASTLTLGIGVTAFCVVYILVSMLLVHNLAPKTFKLRQ